jgi:hypothetical protein
MQNKVLKNLIMIDIGKRKNIFRKMNFVFKNF